MKKLVLAALAACSAPAKPQPVPPPHVEPTPVVEPVVAPVKPAEPVVEDPYLWLEEVTSDKSLAWAREQNKRSQGELEAVPTFGNSRDRVRAILDSKEKIPSVSKQGALYYNFWKDADHPKGIWRRTTLAEYKKKDPKWELVLDVDALAKSENESWVYKGARCLYPKADRCLVSLSRGGGDAVVVRELDTTSKKFVADGFTVPEAKSRVAWKDKDTLYIGTNFGDGSLTKSGYPRIVK